MPAQYAGDPPRASGSARKGAIVALALVAAIGVLIGRLTCASRTCTCPRRELYRPADPLHRPADPPHRPADPPHRPADPPHRPTAPARDLHRSAEDRLQQVHHPSNQPPALLQPLPPALRKPHPPPSPRRQPNFSPPRPPRQQPLHEHIYPDIDVGAVIAPRLPFHLRLSIAVHGRGIKADACISAQLQQWRRNCAAGLDMRVSIHATDPWADRAEDMRASERFCRDSTAGSLAITVVPADAGLKHDLIHQYRRVWLADVKEGWAHWYLFHEEDGGITLEHIAVLLQAHRDYAGPQFWPLLLRTEPWAREANVTDHGLVDVQRNIGKVDCGVSSIWWGPKGDTAFVVPCTRYSAYTFVDADFVARAVAQTIPPFVPPDDLCRNERAAGRTAGWGDHIWASCREQFSQWWPPWGWWGGNWTGAENPRPVVPLSQWRNYLVAHLDTKMTTEPAYRVRNDSVQFSSMEDTLRCLTVHYNVYRRNREQGVCHASHPVRESYPDLDRQGTLGEAGTWRTNPLLKVACPGDVEGDGQHHCHKTPFVMLRIHHYSRGAEALRCECVWNNAKARRWAMRTLNGPRKSFGRRSVRGRPP
eukprot:TRINITY_DN4529_c0_g1_i1.p1 TRINITY_DN4529_c0_g1~~TRINITY_DN4529_c0_g1_i1.p1  ORF type:complete len:590 (+),score=3.96 TRINITY_DN4529_c0_g1_i1:86-1855(+)